LSPVDRYRDLARSLHCFGLLLFAIAYAVRFSEMRWFTIRRTLMGDESKLNNFKVGQSTIVDRIMSQLWALTAQ
jgi:hypothetical protein